MVFLLAKRLAAIHLRYVFMTPYVDESMNFLRCNLLETRSKKML